MVGWPSAASRRSGFSRIHLNRVSGLIGLLTYGAYGLLNDAWLNGHAEEHLVPFWGRFASSQWMLPVSFFQAIGLWRSNAIWSHMSIPSLCIRTLWFSFAQRASGTDEAS